MSHTATDTEPTQPPPGDDHAFFGQPRGLMTLSGLEVWERFSFLGMQAILVLYFADTVARGGMGMEAGTAASVSAAYGTLVYLVSVAGGWLADRILGSYRAVLYGGILIACGHYAMAVPTDVMTWTGLGLISAGTGLLKPNVATMVGKLYRTEDQRRDAGFALYYMGINIGAFLGPLVTGWLGDHASWHWGFSAAAFGMTIGLVQYVLGRRHLAGRKHSAEFALAPAAMRRAVRLIVIGAVVVAAVATALALAGWLTMGRFVDVLTLVSVIAPVVYFAVMFRSPRVTSEERGRLRPYVVLFLASVVFNFILFQAYSTMILLASTNARTEIFGFHFPASWYASALGAFEVALAPVVAAVWARMGPRQPHASNKIAIGVILGGLSFLLMVLPTSGHTGDTFKMAAWWIVGSYLLLGLGDILLETSGMSATTKLAPKAFASQTMALWFLSLALANGIQAQVVKLYGEVSNPAYFGVNGAIAVVAGVAVIAAAPWLKRTMHPVH
ncbi:MULTISPECIES: peptide MFS transporter [unclassified Streptomyces]|uniref:peptide MFS transporter n=1 Tax=unclassified Streptomyces TaxID=2593676 RepID=UPI0022509DF5|nr:MULTISPECIES: peptide MFS transporter [unclassified Streptomyces]WSP56820.1 peptide MFS transporter [Streptomyces sp. NBC_01241]WSU22462.1 peptide MFS transporter [Streptomyces sp. NBC_01108]MCX4788597.1 peptide MFS transporter [Streptomyces sp. NBC_01221]MCX4795656.1 peptide MFS transporter [Streptomyces sp. NBC_01242]WSJ36953.1 peptide MFS transporter [Streptomyces sp. NBC_01321]